MLGLAREIETLHILLEVKLHSPTVAHKVRYSKLAEGELLGVTKPAEAVIYSEVRVENSREEDFVTLDRIILELDALRG